MFALSFARRSIECRERVRMKQAKLYGQLRLTVLAIGSWLQDQKLIEARDDVFFLTHGELAQVLSGASILPRSFREVVAARKREHEKTSWLEVPNHFWLPDGKSYEGEKASTREATRKLGKLSNGEDKGERQLKGVSACGGRVEAAIKVIESVTESGKLSPGDILVTRQTDPGWGPVFPLISGIVMERGGMLSHGAIIAREFGIPAVVAVKNATTTLKQVPSALLDGDQGCVFF
jgi:pyruvate,water dikinase